MADVDREQVTALWREAAAALDEPPLDEIRSRAEAVLDNARAKFGSLVDDSRGGTVELARDVLTVLAECGRLREQLDAARQTAENVEAESVAVRRGTYWKVAAGEGDTVAVLIPVAEWEALRAALGVEGEQEKPT